MKSVSRPLPALQIRPAGGPGRMSRFGGIATVGAVAVGPGPAIGASALLQPAEVFQWVRHHFLQRCRARRPPPRSASRTASTHGVERLRRDRFRGACDHEA